MAIFQKMLFIRILTNKNECTFFAQQKYTFEAPHFYLAIWHFLKSKNEISYNKP